MNRQTKKTAGFTLIEIMVVIGIIIVLMGLLLPVLSRVRATARRSATTAQLSGIATACEAYYQNFRSYPSAISSRDYAGVTAGTFSESQGLVASLTRAIFPKTVTPPAGCITLGSTIPNSVVATSPMTIAADQTAPRDYSETSGSGFRNYNTFFNPKPGELITTTCGLDPTKDVPVFADTAYGIEAMPILYYRMDVKYDPSVGNRTVLDNYQVVNPPAQGLASFYLGANDYLAGQMLSATASSTCQASNIGNFRVGGAGQLPGTMTPPPPTYPAPGSTYLEELVSQTTTIGGTTFYSVRGSFVLISAGNDRIYGRNFKTGVPNGVAPDDVVIVGGN